MKKNRHNFYSYVSNVYNMKHVVIISHEYDDFGNIVEIKNNLTLEQAERVLERLKLTLQEFKSKN